MVTYHVGIHRRGDNVDGWVLELPGCRVIGSTVDEVNSLVPVVASDFVSWLRSKGEDVEEGSRFEVVEDVEGVPDHAFEAETAPLGEEEFETMLRWMAHAQADLEATLAPLREPVLRWKPPASAVKIDMYPDVRSIEEMIEHVGLVEPNFYVRNVVESPAQPATAASQEAAPLEQIHRLTEAQLRSLDAASRSRIFERPLRTGGTGYWTVRKVIRRAISHKRFHTREVLQRLCWLTLGVPAVLPESRE